MEGAFFGGSASVPDHMWPQVPQNSIGWLQSLPPTRRVFPDPQAGQDGIFAGDCDTVAQPTTYW
jgi:hypothetical protein